jgi:hypothetical protein
MYIKQKADSKIPPVLEYCLFEEKNEYSFQCGKYRVPI